MKILQRKVGTITHDLHGYIIGSQFLSVHGVAFGWKVWNDIWTDQHNDTNLLSFIRTELRDRR